MEKSIKKTSPQLFNLTNVNLNRFSNIFKSIKFILIIFVLFISVSSIYYYSIWQGNLFSNSTYNLNNVFKLINQNSSFFVPSSTADVTSWPNGTNFLNLINEKYMLVVANFNSLGNWSIANNIFITQGTLNLLVSLSAINLLLLVPLLVTKNGSFINILTISLIVLLLIFTTILFVYGMCTFMYMNDLFNGVESLTQTYINKKVPNYVDAQTIYEKIMLIFAKINSAFTWI